MCLCLALCSQSQDNAAAKEASEVSSVENRTIPTQASMFFKGKCTPGTATRLSHFKEFKLWEMCNKKWLLTLFMI